MPRMRVHVKVPVTAWADSWCEVDVPDLDQGHSLAELINADPDAQDQVEENLHTTQVTAVRWLDMEVVD